MKKRILYFGHPVNVYDTSLENHLLISIITSTEFLGWEVENPNQPHHQQAYDALVAAGKRGMDHYFERVLPGCDGGVFLAFRDGKWPFGVYGEMEWLFARGKPVWRISPEGWIERLSALPAPSDVLGIDETRARIRTPDERRRPY